MAYQSGYVDRVLERFGMADCNVVATPMTPHTYISKQDCPEVADPRLVKYYQQLIGSLMYLACATRPDTSLDGCLFVRAVYAEAWADAR